MGVLEWLALITLAFTLLAYIIKGYTDKASVEVKLEALERWKNKMEATDFLTTQRHEQMKTDCRTEIYKDLSRVERRFEEFQRTMEQQNVKISEVRENVIKIITLLENNKEN